MFALDDAWRSCRSGGLYAFDCDDYMIQNSRSLLLMHHFGLRRKDVEIISVLGGIVKEIYTRQNPGFAFYRDDFVWTIQWVNYWSKGSRERMFRSWPEVWPKGIEVLELPDGGVRVRLGKRPGRYDDVNFHRLQLAFRRVAPFAASAQWPVLAVR